MIKRNYELEVLINGHPVKEYFHDYKTYIEGRKNSTFSLRIKNNSFEKVLFVPTVDGLSVIDGKNGSFDSRGYIVNGYSSVTIDGWRLDDNKIAEFYFTSPEDSYRKRKEMGSNLGSIAVAVFREKEKHNYTYIQLPIPFQNDDNLPKKQPWIFGEQHPFTNNETYMKGSAMSNCSFTASSCFRTNSQEVGTGFGNTKRSEVTTATFDREEKPDTLLEIFYNTRKQLESLGIDFVSRLLTVSEPNSFPNEKGYCERPSN